MCSGAFFITPPELAALGNVIPDLSSLGHCLPAMAALDQGRCTLRSRHAICARFVRHSMKEYQPSAVMKDGA